MERELYIELTFEINFGYFLTSDQCCNERLFCLAVLDPLTLDETSETDSMWRSTQLVAVGRGFLLPQRFLSSSEGVSCPPKGFSGIIRLYREFWGVVRDYPSPQRIMMGCPATRGLWGYSALPRGFFRSYPDLKRVLRKYPSYHRILRGYLPAREYRGVTIASVEFEGLFCLPEYSGWVFITANDSIGGIPLPRWFWVVLSGYPSYQRILRG